MTRKHGVNGNHKGGIGKIVTGLVIGSVVGATVGLLMAPATGQEIRHKIKGEVKEARTRAREFAGNIEDKGREVIGDARDNIENIRENIAERVTSVKTRASK
jgi:gas vesicle protein